MLISYFFVFTGETTFAFWEILVSLLQEDDEQINEMAAKIVSRLNPEVQGQLTTSMKFKSCILFLNFMFAFLHFM